MIRNNENNNRKLIFQGFKGKPKRFYGYMRGMQTIKENVTLHMWYQNIRKVRKQTKLIIDQYL